MVDWQPIILAVAAAIPVLVAAIATFIQVRANGSKLNAVHQQTNGGLDDLRSRMAAIERHLHQQDRPQKHSSKSPPSIPPQP